MLQKMLTENSDAIQEFSVRQQHQDKESWSAVLTYRQPGLSARGRQPPSVGVPRLKPPPGLLPTLNCHVLRRSSRDGYRSVTVI